MRLTGSFQTMVTHGVARTVISSGVVVGSTSTGLAVGHGSMVHTALGYSMWPSAHRAADRPLRADHAPGRAGRRYGGPPVGLRAVRAAAPGGTALRRGRGGRPGPGRDRGVPVRRRGPRGARRRGRRGDGGLAGRLPVLRRRVGLRRGRDLLRALTAADRRGHLRGGGGARDRAALDLQPRLGDRVGRLADDAGRRRPALHRDGLAAHPRGGRGGGRPGGVRRGVREHLQPGGPAPLRRTDHGHQRALVHAAPRQRGGSVPRPGELARHRDHAAGRHLRHRRGGPARRRGGRHRARRRAHRLRATWGCSPSRSERSSTPSARPGPASS